ncbi:MAG TPA: hypothetical protein VFT16_04310 [Candidatus Saccharimonadales bacterium]|nr:hypothetical protein [Candidatus Saccharimonadales bacterium]
MDPQKNVNPTASDEEKVTTPLADAPQEPATPTETPEEALPTPNMEDESPASATPVTDAAEGGDEQQASLASTPDTTPVATPEQPSSEVAPSADANPAPPVSEATMPQSDAPTDLQAPLGDSTVTPGTEPSAMPPVAPAAVPHNDKKTIFVLLAVAVVLIAAIAVLYFL